MKKRGWLILTGCLVLGLAIAAAWRWAYPGLPREVMAGLREVKSWTLYSLDAERTLFTKPESYAGEEQFHDFVVLGHMPLDDPQLAISTVEDIDRSVSIFNDSKCGFLPRHGLRGRLSDGRQLDLLICYECGEILIYVDDVMKASLSFDGHRSFKRPGPAPLNKLLTAQGIPLGP